MALQSAMYSICIAQTLYERSGTDKARKCQYNIHNLKIIIMTKINTLKTKRFVIRKNLIGKGVIINFTNKEGKSFKYNHDEVFKVNKQRFEAMNCFKKYKSYTATNNVPTFARELVIQ